MKIRWKLLILLMLIALAPLLAATVIHNFMAYRLGGHLAAGTRKILIENARQQLELLADDYGRILARDQGALELALNTQVREVERRLAAERPSKPAIHFSADYDEGKRLPKGMRASEMHFRYGADGEARAVDVTYEQQVAFLAAGVDASDKAVAADLARLSTMPAVYKSVHDALPGIIYWQYTSTETGIHTSYPGHGGYPAEYDPRKRPWYVKAKGAGKLTWMPPIPEVSTRTVTLTLSAPVRRPDGRVAGVTAIDVPLTGIFAELNLPDDLARHAEVMIVIPGAAGGDEDKLIILAQKSYQVRQDWQTPVELEFLSSDEPVELADMVARAKAGQSCVLQMRRGGQDALWACCAGEGREKAFPVVIVPYERIIAQADQAERYVWEKVVQGLEISGALMLAAVIVVAAVAFLASRSVTRPIRELAAAGERLAEGDYDARADIRTGDELQELGEVFNAVGPQLKEREKMKQSLALAMEIQQQLLPAGPPKLEGFDIAGRCDYCDETGGDYYDFIDLVDLAPGKMGIAVGDVTGHGIGAALLMASARAVLRSHAGKHGGDLAELFAALNAHLCRDTGDDRFMTLFYGVLDAPSRSLQWTSGGHDPALWLRHADGRFEELPNTGVPLGIIDGAPFDQAGPATLESGDIIVIGTDGIWEAANAEKELFGKDRLRAVIAANAGKSSEDIHAAVVEAVHAFRAGEPQRDDITLVVIKAV